MATMATSRGGGDGMFKCRDCGKGVDDPEAHECAAKQPENAAGVMGFLSESYNKWFGAAGPSEAPANGGDGGVSRAMARASLAPSRRVTHAPPQGSVPLSDIMVYKDNMDVDCKGCKGMILQGDEIVCIGMDVLHASCCFCVECNLSADRDEYGSDGWMRESDGAIVCADCLTRYEEDEAYEQPNTVPAGGDRGAPAKQAQYMPPSPVSPPPKQVRPDSMCGTCKMAIPHDAPAVTHAKLEGSHHPMCLQCQHCRRPLSDTFGPKNPAHMRQGKPLCHPCYLATLPRCGGCKAVIARDTRVCAALGQKFHPQCFACAKCGDNFPDKSFYVLDNKPFCRWCYHEENGSICGGCTQPIEGACACVVEGRFHPKCFVCSTCRVPLSDVYYACEGKPFCERHVMEFQRSRGRKGATAERRQTLFRNI